MNRIVKIVNGKRYLVNVAGWNDDVGPGAPAGQLWMQSSTTGEWYPVYIVGSSESPSSLTMSVSQSVLPWQSADWGTQLVACNDGFSYIVYLTGSVTSASLFVSQSAYGSGSLGKPSLVLKSITDGNYYSVNLVSGSDGVKFAIDPHVYASASWIGYY